MRASNRAISSLDVISGLGLRMDDNDSVSSESDMFAYLDAPANAITSLCFDDSGMTLLAGTSEGAIGVYDIRKNTPMFVKSHNNSLRMQKLQFHTCFDKKQVISADTKGIKIWDASTGETYLSMDTSAELYSFAVPKSGEGRDGGVIMAACDTPHVNIFFAPQLGPAPAWCSYLENITEELEEADTAVGQFEDFKFVTQAELETLNLTHLLEQNSDQVRPYMHGFYVDLNLYRTTKAIMDPQEWRDFKRQKMLDKKEAEDRITVVKRKKENLLKPVAEEQAEEPIDRFAPKNDKFAVDVKSEAYQKYHPGEKMDAFRTVGDDSDIDSDGASSGLSDTAPALPRRQANTTAPKKVQMFELKEGRNIMESTLEQHQGSKRERHEKLTLGERLKKHNEKKMKNPAQSTVRTVDGGATKEIKWSAGEQKTPRSNTSEFKYKEDDDGGKGGKGQRRSFSVCALFFYGAQERERERESDTPFPFLCFWVFGFLGVKIK